MQEPRTEGIDEAKQRRIMRSAYRWNTAAGILFALQSVIMLVVLTRVCDVYVAGVFTIAFANANLFMAVGKFGMRKFQVSDRVGEFSFREYHRSRIASCVAMMATSAAYIAYSSVAVGYSPDKTFVMIVMCLFKATDAFEDVYTGGYQLQDRLDVGARMVTLRLAVTMVVFIALTIAFADLTPALTATTVFSAVFLAGQVKYVRSRYHMPTLGQFSGWRRVVRLLRECLPLFAADFLLFYIGNAPKYAIDALMDDAAQAYYGYIAMPVFVVTLLASFVYSPMITSLTDQWRERDVRGFLMRFLKLGAVIAGMTAACVTLAWLFGVPVLNILYNTQVESYLIELLVLVAGGGFLAVTTLETLGITIIRFQRVLVPLYLALSVLAFFISNWTVAQWGIAGASWAYFGVMAASSVVFAAVFGIGIQKMRAE